MNNGLRTLLTRALVACYSLILIEAGFGHAAVAQTPPPPPPANPPAASSMERVQMPTYRLRMLGVFDAATGDPLQGVEVIDVLTGTKAETSKDGLVSLFYLPEGGSLVRLRKIGFEQQTLAVSISPVDTTPLTIVLAHATQLAPVVVTDSAPHYISPALRGFEERRKQGFGYFIPESIMRKNDDRSLASLIPNQVPGVIAVSSRRGTSTYIASGRKMCNGPALRLCTSPDCIVDVYQDGVKQVGPVDVNRLEAREFAAIEFYHAGPEMPAQYNSTSGGGCGVLLLWSRER